MKFRVHEGEAMDRRSVRPGMGLWGSDEDLAADVGVGMDPELLSLTEVCFCSIYRPPGGGILFSFPMQPSPVFGETALKIRY